MKPVAIFRHSPAEGPGFFSEFLDVRQIPWQLFAIDRHDSLPGSAVAYSGLVFMGGPMSVNDDLPWIAQELELIRDAMARQIPVLGHCLGGQLMSKALGAEVTANGVKEIGWGLVSVAEGAQHWFGEVQQFYAFHWHGETFSLPQGALPLLSSQFCSNQGYAIAKHLALQCHVEMTESMIAAWCENGAEELVNVCASVQSASEIQQQTHLPQLQEMATRLYSRWITGLSG